MTGKRKSTKKNVSFLIMQQREIGAAEFKAHCLEIMDEVERLGAEVVITKHRKPVAKLIPFVAQSKKFCGSLAGAVLDFTTDILSPTGEEWTAAERNFT
jgi:prevent-host-death family protein